MSSVVLAFSRKAARVRVRVRLREGLDLGKWRKFEAFEIWGCSDGNKERFRG